ncbi:Uncharacterised protein [Mycobacteroides abscessus]|nr:Uncharacterised protein [Mycobacteroides abscessus]
MSANIISREGVSDHIRGPGVLPFAWLRSSSTSQCRAVTGMVTER